MRRLLAILVVTGTVGAAVPAYADTLAYVRTTSQHEQAQDAARFHPLNLIDDDAETSWCEGAEGLGEGEEIRFFFKREQKIDRIVIGPSDQGGRLVRVVKVSDGVNTIRIKLSSAYAEMKLKRPLQGSTYTVTLETVGGPNKTGTLAPDVTCLAEVLLYWKKRPFGGKTPLSKLRYNERRDTILGPWAGEPLGAPERFLTFAIDGTWDWKFVPLLGGRNERRNGEYRFRGNRLLMRRGETGRWADMRFTFRKVVVDAEELGSPESDYEVISLGAKALGADIAGEYNNAQF